MAAVTGAAVIGGGAGAWAVRTGATVAGDGRPTVVGGGAASGAADAVLADREGHGTTSGGKVVAAGYRGFAPDATIVGDAAAVARAFEEYAQMGFTDILIRNLVPDQDKALASIGRMAEVKALVTASSRG